MGLTAAVESLGSKPDVITGGPAHAESNNVTVVMLKHFKIASMRCKQVQLR